VNRNGPIPAHRPDLGPCHEWTSSKSDRGYGLFAIGGTHHNQKAHRVAFWLEHGRWPEPAALHLCDNRPCVNPAHLAEGTQRDNLADMRAKGRAAPMPSRWTGRRAG
jgi:hypothetical protein